MKMYQNRMQPRHKISWWSEKIWGTFMTHSNDVKGLFVLKQKKKNKNAPFHFMSLLDSKAGNAQIEICNLDVLSLKSLRSK